MSNRSISVPFGGESRCQISSLVLVLLVYMMYDHV